MRRLGALIIGLLLALPPSTVHAEAGPPTAILMPGGSGAPVAHDFLVRNERRFRDAGIETAIAERPDEAVALAGRMSREGKDVVFVGMSRGAIRAAAAIAAGAPASRVVFVSPVYHQVKAQLGMPSRLPPTLVVQHPRDECDMTSAQAVREFMEWAGERAMIRWIETRGASGRNPCGPRGAHGFHMQDEQAVAAIVEFLRLR